MTPTDPTSALREALQTVNDWLHAHVIASADDMAQSFEAMTALTDQALATTPAAGTVVVEREALETFLRAASYNSGPTEIYSQARDSLLAALAAPPTPNPLLVRALEVLEPFARAYDLNVPLAPNPDHPDDACASYYIPDTALDWGDFRKAATLAQAIRAEIGKGAG